MPEPPVELLTSREAHVGGLTVRRALPKRAHRTVGAWCFADHYGPVAETEGADIGPHPHMGLQTVTWLVAGELVHHDSLGSVQLIRPGQLNLMTAGHGIAHAEESTAQYTGDLHGIQLWVAQPDATRDTAPAFEHHAELPQVDLDGAVATVLVGAIGDTVSPARRDTDHIGAELALRPGRTTVPVDRRHEHALIVLSGSALAGGTLVEPGHLAYLGLDRDEITLTATADARAMLLGGVPFPEPIFMWWNFVARDATEVDVARAQWQAQEGRFGAVSSRHEWIAAPTPVWAGTA